MSKYTKIELQKDTKYVFELRNEITDFLDKYNISSPEDDDYRDIHKTYISIFNSDISEFINNDNDVQVLSFRIVGATRGGIYLKELHRDSLIVNNNPTISIHYEIKNIEFCNSTCFECFKAYKKDVVADSNKKFRGKELIINIKL